jgi:hypothetical protein
MIYVSTVVKAADQALALPGLRALAWTATARQSRCPRIEMARADVDDCQAVQMAEVDAQPKWLHLV